MAASKDGARFMILAVIFFAVAHASVKALSHLPFEQLVFLRQVLAMSFCLAMMWQRGVSPWGKNKKLLILRGLVGTLALACYFYSLQNMPLASAVTLQFLSPVVTLIMAHWFLHEPTSARNWLYFGFAFVGVLMVKGFDARISNFALFISMIGVIGSAAAYTSVRALKAFDHELVVVFYFPLVTIPIVGPFAFAKWVSPVGWDWLMIIVVGIFTFLAQLFMTMSYQRDKAEDVGIYNYLGLLFAIGIGYFYFGESFSVLSLVGMSVILLSVFLATQARPGYFQSLFKK